MQRFLLTILALSLLTGCSTNQLRLTGYGLLAADWQQTRQIDTNEFVETNPVLGEAPSKSETDLYYGSIFAGLLLGDYFLPEDWRRAMLMVLIAVEGVAVGNNLAVGVEF